MLYLRFPAEIKKKCKNIKKSGGSTKMYGMHRVRSLFNLSHDPDKLLLNFWNKE